MRFAPLEPKMRAEWRDMLGRADAARLGAAALMFFLSALALPLCNTEAVAGLYLLYAVLFYYTLTHSFGAVLAVAVPGILLYGASALAPGLPHPFLLPAVYTALILGGIGGGFLLIHCREKKHLSLLALPVLAFGIASLAADPLRALLVLVPVALSLILGKGILDCRAQTPVLLCTAGALALSGIVFYLVCFALSGWPAPNPISYLGQAVRDGVSEAFRSALALYEQQGISIGISDTDLYNIGAALGNILPGLYLAACGVLAFVIYRINLRVLGAWGTLKRVPVRIGAMAVSPAAAALFLVFYLASAVGGVGLFGTVCENVVLVLQPPLILVGVTALLAREGGRRSTLSFLLLVGLAVLLFNYPTLALTLCAFVGAFRILLAAFAAARGKKNEKK